MPDPYTVVFLGLLAVYVAYSIWTRLDGRLPIAAALVLLVAAAALDAAGSVAAANTLAEFVFYLLGAGVLLLLVEHVRASRAPAPERDAGPPGERDGADLPPEG